VNREPDASTVKLAERTGANAVRCEVVSTTRLSTSLVEIALRGSAVTLAGAPGNDIMIRLNDANGRL